MVQWHYFKTSALFFFIVLVRDIKVFNYFYTVLFFSSSLNLLSYFHSPIEMSAFASSSSVLSGIAIVHDELKGRCLCALRDYKPSEIIIEEDAFVFATYKKYETDFPTKEMSKLVVKSSLYICVCLSICLFIYLRLYYLHGVVYRIYIIIYKYMSVHFTVNTNFVNTFNHIKTDLFKSTDKKFQKNLNAMLNKFIKLSMVASRDTARCLLQLIAIMNSSEYCSNPENAFKLNLLSELSATNVSFLFIHLFYQICYILYLNISRLLNPYPSDDLYLYI